MILLEQHPTRVDVLEKYVAALDAHSDNYKWVMRCLSVTVSHIYGVQNHSADLESILDKSLAAAMERKDDFAVMSFIPYFTFTTKTAADLYKQLEAYVKLRRNEGANSGEIVMLEVYCYSLAIMEKKKMSNILTATQSMLDDVLNQNRNMFGFLLLHPRATLRAHRLYKIIDKSVEHGSTDPTMQMLNILIGEVSKVVDGDKLEATTIIKMMVDLHYMRVERNTTLASAAEAVVGAINVLKIFPDHLVHRGTMELTEQVNMDNISIRALSNLQVAALINREYGNRQAIEQAKDLISLVRRLRPEGHHDILSAIESYGDVCYAFGEEQSALNSYIEVFNHWYVNAPDSAQLTGVAKKILRLGSLSTHPISVIQSVTEAAMVPYDATERYRYELLRLFSRFVLKKHENEQLSEMEQAIAFLWRGVDEGLGCLNTITLTGQQALLSLLEQVSSLSTNIHRQDYVSAAQRRMRQMEKSRKKEIRHSAKAGRLFSEAYFEYSLKREGAAELLDKTVSYCINKRTSRFQANTAFWLLIGKWMVDCGDGTAKAYFGKFVSDPSLLKPLDQLIDAFCTRCIDVSEWTQADDNALQQAKMLLVRDHLNYAAEKHLSDLCIPPKVFKRLRTAEKFYAEALIRLLREEIAEHSQNPIRIRPRTKSGQ